MTRIVFWNVQRLGAGTPQARQEALHQIRNWNGIPDVYLFCELVSTCPRPLAQDLNYRRLTHAQLCYGAMNHNYQDIQLTAVVPRLATSYKGSSKGGNDFKLLADRALAQVGTYGGVDVYLIHAPASNKARKVMSFIACSMDEHHPGNWLVVGDFNVEPDVLASAPVRIDVGSYIRRSGVATHRSATPKELDYALSNMRASRVQVQAAHPSLWQQFSDHAPIQVEF
jgi:endonuclease/exonuclease/phosphatase family metal-dependent hydrolase